MGLNDVSEGSKIRATPRPRKGLIHFGFGYSDYQEDTDTNSEIPGYSESATQPDPDEGMIERSLEEIGEGLLANITAEVSKWSSQKELADIKEQDSLLETYTNDIRSCKQATNRTHPTILHWIVGVCRVGTTTKKKITALKNLIVLVLRLDPGLLTESKDGDTALHEAHYLPKNEAQSLAWTMCCPRRILINQREPLDARIEKQLEEWKVAAGEAAGKLNSKGETCLHLAIEKNWLSLARYLVSIMKPPALIAQRKNEADGKPLARGGNTALHDAVDYQRCQTHVPHCVEGENSVCAACQSASQKGLNSKNLIMSFYSDLVKTNDNALFLKNRAGETPYLLLNAAIRANDKKGKSEGLNGNAGLKERVDLQMPDNPNGLSHRSDNLDSSKRRTAGQHRHDERSLPKCSQKGTLNSSVPTTPIDPGISKIAIDRDGTTNPTLQCSTKRKSFASEVLAYLWEMAFTLGGFQKACECLFSEKLGEKREFSFIPNVPVMGGMLSGYSFLEFPEVMSQVHLQVSAMALPDNQKYLLTIFDELRERGVRRILRVTVEDDFDNPCTDEVIESCIRGLDVRYIDWRKPDLCLDVLVRAAPNVVELTLYSSGSSVVLRGWASTGGVCNLNRMTKLIIQARKGRQNYGRYLRDINIFEHEITSIIWSTRMKHFIIARRDYYLTNLKEGRERECSIREKLNNDVTISELSNDHGKKVPFTANEVQNLQEAHEEENELDELHKELANMEVQVAEENLKLLELANTGETLEANRKKILCGPLSRAPMPQDNQEEWNQLLKSLHFDARSDDFKKQALIILPSGDRTSQLNLNCIAPDFGVKINKDEPPREPASPPIAAKSNPTDTDNVQIAKPNQWLKAVDAFWNQFEETHQDTLTERNDIEIKLALIDDGVSTCEDNFGDSIVKGWPFKPAWSDEPPYYHSARNHGTRMARLIRHVCPPVKFYVAKLGAWKQEMDLKNDLESISAANKATEAVEWATRERVHIISMSWSLLQTKINESATEKLGKAINKATDTENRVIAYCSTNDKGVFDSSKKLYPQESNTKGIKTIGSADTDGNKSKFVNGTRIDYLCPGEDLPELKDINGSSAATALAAGLAALILWCHAWEGGPDWEKKFKVTGWQNMKAIFQGMKVQEGFIDVTMLLRTKEGGVATVKEVVDQCQQWSKSPSFNV